jgi:hypothetical protein
MLKSTLVALSLLIIAAAVYPASAQKGSPMMLTALDYAEIQQLYASYNWAIDFGQADGRDWAALWASDGMFINVVPIPKSGSCPSVSAPWRPADRGVIRATIADTKGSNMCVTTVTGSDDLAAMAKGVHAGGSLRSRHTTQNIQITPAADGAVGHAYLLQYSGATAPATLVPSGFYEDGLVKTAAGWRFKRRIRTEDLVVNAPKP